MKKAEKTLNTNHLCRLFNVPIASYYYQPVIKLNEATYRHKIKAIHENNFNSYGRRRMKVELTNQGIQLGVFKIARLMKDAGVLAKTPKKPHYYPSGKLIPNIPNRLKRQFNPDQINTHWVGDITYIRSYRGWSYLATVLDLGSREIVGYALSQTPDAALTRQALIHAIAIQKPDAGELMFHSDQGVQYSADKFKQTLSLHGITQSMSRRGNCWESLPREALWV